MDITLILIIIGFVCIIASFFFKNSNSLTDEIEQISISLHQETHQLKKRIKAIEEELLIGPPPLAQSTPKKTTSKPVHEIIVNQILALHAQGYTVEEMAQRSSLEPEVVRSVLQSRGVKSF